MNSETQKSRGRLTLPVQTGMGKELEELISAWGADAVRDSDGTQLAPEIESLDAVVYSTLCLVRADQQWAKDNPDQLQQKFLMTDPITARADELQIEPLEKFFSDQFALDMNHDPKRWWEVWDRTEGTLVDAAQWSFDGNSGTVTITGAKPFHAYTVSFLVYQIWDSTSMYNHLTNNWTGPHPMSVDPFLPKARKHLLEFLDCWCKDHPRTDVVRFTSLAYHFPNIYNNEAKPRYRDWSGYLDCISPTAIEAFENEKGYRLTAEDFVRAGTYNDMTLPPSQKYRNWIDFIHANLTAIVKEWVDCVHKHNKKAMVFFCDHWIGSEPYGPHFDRMGFDAIVNPCAKGMELRRIADTPAKIEKEVRLYPYFFPVDLAGKPSFDPGGDPVTDCRNKWVLVRRAMLQNLVDRIGFGGYLDLAVKRPEFVEYVSGLADEFRTFHRYASKGGVYKAPIRVAVLNSWGKLRSWINGEFHMSGSMEALSGMNVEVEFIDFNDVLDGCLDSGIDVIVNSGSAGSAWSGGDAWKDARVLTRIRRWVDSGGAIIGIGDPSACEYQGRFFQLCDVFGIDRELDHTRGRVKMQKPSKADHFILDDGDGTVELGYIADRAYCFDENVDILAQLGDSVLVAANRYGEGRAVYFAGLRFSWQNVRLLKRALHWATRKENALQQWFSSAQGTECAAFPDANVFVVLNNIDTEVRTTVWLGDGSQRSVTLEPLESRWLTIKE